MKTNQFIKKTMGAVMIGTAMLLGTSSAFAQVKIGNNPTTIGTSNNLEVESSTGMKTSIHKTTGQVTIVDGTQGTGKVFTSDAVGGGSWQSTRLVQATVNYVNDGVTVVPIGPTPVPGNVSITFPENGTYAVNFSVIADATQPFPLENSWIGVNFNTQAGGRVLGHYDNLVPGSTFAFISAMRYLTITNAPTTLYIYYFNLSQVPFTMRGHNSVYNDWFAYKVF